MCEAMALTECLEIKKNSQLLVNVEEVLLDIIVVSFQNKSRLFQGVLLDSKKKLLPCGIVAPASIGPPLGDSSLSKDDQMFTTSQRFSYFQENHNNKKSNPPPAKFKNARMTVRLRPRQVLCSKCRGICNENSENVDATENKRKLGSDCTDSVSTSKPAKPVRRLRSSRDISPSSVFPDNAGDQNSGPPSKKKKCLHSESNVQYSTQNNKNLNGRIKRMKKVVSDKTNRSTEGVSCEQDPLSIPPDDETCSFLHQGLGDSNGDDLDPLDVSNANPSRVTRKKRSVGLMEDLWDENVFEDTSRIADLKPVKTKTPVIKITFGSASGEGTVLKIASKPQDVPSSENEGDDKLSDKSKRDASAKAAKKALKKAKKEARRKIVEVSSPKSIGASSPRYSALSPRYIASNLSPRQTIGNVSPQLNMPKKHKHKGKHKKKHKEEKKQKGWSEIVGSQLKVKGGQVVQECLKQKLSINLKRLNANAYMRCESSSPTASDCSDEPSDAVPNFPVSQNVMHRVTDTVTICQTNDGKQISVGDVVWGKIHGFPWWPAKVLSITQSFKDDSTAVALQAHVAWYGSSTSSLVATSSLNPFLETFQMRYNKKKRGPYKEAIKQATTEARRVDIDVNCDIYQSPPEVGVAS